jgi:hypothetical protein
LEQQHQAMCLKVENLNANAGTESRPLSYAVEHRSLQNRLNPIFKSTQFAIDDPPPTLPVESYQSNPLFFQDPIGDRVVLDSSVSLLPSQLEIFFSFHLFSKLSR